MSEIELPSRNRQPLKVKEKLIIENRQSPGDIVMLTAAIRDLHRAAPGRFLTDVRTPCSALWRNNPHISQIGDEDEAAKRITCNYPLIHRSNTEPWHFIHGFHQGLEKELGISIPPTQFKGDIHVSRDERVWMSQVHEIVGGPVPFWIVVGGGKRDFTAKWWDPKRWEEVIAHFKDRVLFVQVGEKGHHHPALGGALDLRGKTELRQLVRLVYHAQGVICPVTLAMHLAAAVEVRGRCEAYPRGMPQNRPCVVVAGGREPSQWEAYPHHQYIHTNGSLRCCDQGGCWKSRVVPLGDGDDKDDPSRLCADVVELDSGVRKPGAAWAAQGVVEDGIRDFGEEWRMRYLPRCLDMISAEDVIRRVEMYFSGGAVDFLTPNQARACRDALTAQSASQTDP